MRLIIEAATDQEIMMKTARETAGRNAVAKAIHRAQARRAARDRNPRRARVTFVAASTIVPAR